MKRIREIIKEKAYDKWGECRLDSSTNFLEDLSNILVTAIKQCDSEFLAANAKYALESGACLLILLIIGKFVITANLGNCKAFLFTQGQVVRLSTDHYPVLFPY